jgi:ferredoxin
MKSYKKFLKENNMKILNLLNECTACGGCVSVCPKQCVDLKFDNEGFYYPYIDNEKCVKCGKCENVCHVLNYKKIDAEKTSYYGFIKNEEIRNKSTSGGAFYALADSVLKNGGNVYGAAFDYKDLQLKHISTDEVGIVPLLKSKYIESYMGNTAALIQNDINNGRQALFCGTPCQAAGIKNTVKDEKGLLTTVDFICHGVPSSALFKEHLSNIIKNEELINMDFRPKDKGWSCKAIRLITNKKKTEKPYYLDTFYKGFMTENVILRRSCYNCKYRDIHHSDITIADFWGYKELNAQLNDSKGLSLIVANNKHGSVQVEALENFELNKIDNKYSDYAYKPKDYSIGLRKREKFYCEYKKYGFEKAAKKTYMKGYFKQTVKYYIKKLLGKV